MTVPDQSLALPAPPELRVDAARVINALKQRLLEEISKAVILESALTEAQERERVLVLEVQRLQQAAQPPGDPKPA